MTHIDAKLAHLGRASAQRERTVNPPLTRASTILFDTLEDLRQARGDVPFVTLPTDAERFRPDVHRAIADAGPYNLGVSVTSRHSTERVSQHVSWPGGSKKRRA